MNDKPVSASRAGEILGVTAACINNWFHEGRFPNAFSIAGEGRNTVRIPLSDIEALKQQPFKKGVVNG